MIAAEQITNAFVNATGRSQTEESHSASPALSIAALKPCGRYHTAPSFIGSSFHKPPTLNRQSRHDTKTLTAEDCFKRYEFP
jgi:hypothetical protein